MVLPGTFLACSAGLFWILLLCVLCSTSVALLLARVSQYCLCAPIPHVCRCPFGNIYALMLSCLTKRIIGCGWFCCYKMRNLHSAAGWAVLEHLCLVPRQADTNCIPCICFQVQWTCALATAQGSLRRPMFCFANAAHLMTTRAVFLPVTWRLPNESLIAKADFPWNLQKAPVSPDSHPSSCPGVKMNFNSFVSWE